MAFSVCNRLPLAMEPKKVDDFIEAAYYAQAIAVDTETSGYEIRDGRGYAMGLSIAYTLAPGVVQSSYFPLRHRNGFNYDRDVWEKLRKLIQEHPHVIFHNAKFDLVSLATLGIRREKYFYDTMIMAHMINENLMSKALDYLSKVYLRDPGKEKAEALDLFIQGAGWELVPSMLMFDYACKDAELTLGLFEFFTPMMENQGFYEKDLWDIEQQFIRLVTIMEGRGVRIDVDLSTQQYDIGVKEMASIQSSLKANPASPKDLEKLLIDDLGLPILGRTPGGKPSFTKSLMVQYDDLLETLGNDNDTAKQVLAYRGWQKTTSSNYKAYLDLLSPDGRLRPNYKIHGTRTGRLSCEKPNLQQIPRSSSNPWNGSLKSAFIPKEGYRLFEADYSQLELRLAAAYANEKSLLDTFAHGRDVFTEMAEELGMPRHDVKTLTYTIQYGGGVNRISNVFRVTAEDAAMLKGNFYDKYPGFRKMTSIASAKARSQGYLRYWSGRRRHFENPREEAHKAFNSVIQGGAAEIMKRTMLRMYNEMDSDDCQMLLQVHDSIVFEVREDKLEAILPEIKRVMEAVDPDMGVKFACDVHEWGKAS